MTNYATNLYTVYKYLTVFVSGCLIICSVSTAPCVLPLKLFCFPIHYVFQNNADYTHFVLTEPLALLLLGWNFRIKSKPDFVVPCTPFPFVVTKGVGFFWYPLIYQQN